jgi:tetratricopeptide (TPR) repeat protein
MRRSRVQRRFGLAAVALAAAFVLQAALADPLTRAQAVASLHNSAAPARLAAVERLAELGTMADADRVQPRMADADPQVRAAAVAAMWQIWSRSGDAAIDALFARGVEQMQAMELDDALATFNDIVRRKPAFAEGWNKRATILFLRGENEKSLRDCDQVLKRNRNHFGALSGAGQIHIRLGNPQRALEFFRRAVRINPNLEGPAQMIPILEQVLRDKAQRTI